MFFRFFLNICTDEANIPLCSRTGDGSLSYRHSEVLPVLSCFDPVVRSSDRPIVRGNTAYIGAPGIRPLRARGRLRRPSNFNPPLSLPLSVSSTPVALFSVVFCQDAVFAAEIVGVIVIYTAQNAELEYIFADNNAYLVMLITAPSASASIVTP